VRLADGHQLDLRRVTQRLVSGAFDPVAHG
jgi:hypothetical protein